MDFVLDDIKVKLQGADERIEFIAENLDEDEESPIVKEVHQTEVNIENLDEESPIEKPVHQTGRFLNPNSELTKMKNSKGLTTFNAKSTSKA